ncbi:MAG: DNA polymerase III subunit delta [Clostridium sp.]|nr:DNA polymerase III subunit delta [Clostridium sp.]
MDYLEIQKLVKKGFKTAVFLYGEDEKIILSVRNLMRSMYLDDLNGLNHIKLDGNSITSDALQDALNTYSMFSDKTFVEISNCHFMEKKDDKNENQKVLIDYLEDPRKDLYLFAYYKYDNELDKRNYFLQNLSRNSSNLSLITSVRALNKRNIKERMIIELKTKGISVSKPVLYYMESVFKGNMLQFEKELDKLIAYSDGEEITKKHIDEIMTISDERHIMNFLDLIFTENGIGRNVREIIDLLNDLLYRGESPQMILGVIGSRIRILFEIKIELEGSSETKEIKKLLRTKSSWYANIMIKKASSISFKAFQNMFETLLDYELTMKTTSTDINSALEMLVISILSSKDY